MKCICIGRNYSEHAKEMGHELLKKPSEPIFFMKPSTAIIQDSSHIRLPSFSQEIHYECEIVIRFAEQHQQIKPVEFTLGLDLTARDLQADCKAKGHPWEKAKAFDGSALIGQQWFPILEYYQNLNREFRFCINQKIVQKGRAEEMIFSLDEMIQAVSRYVTIQPGDLLFTGTPRTAGTAPR
jgi:2-keto-4-pentenoate hydratase/2-oxohepta-3-ene-1,7-dioic acid hydratase in catechol pathway